MECIKLVRTFALWSALVLCPSAFAAPAATPISPEQTLSYVRASDLQLSPDGTKLAYVATSYRWDVKPHLRVLDLKTGVEHELTPAGKSERQPRWSPDGKMLAFLSNRAGRTQVYVGEGDDGAPIALTTRKYGVSSFRWSPDGRSIAYLAQRDDAPSDEEGPQVADRESDLPSLWCVGVGSKNDRELGVAHWEIHDFQWLDTSHILVRANNQPRVEEHTDAIYRLTLGSTALERVGSPPQPFNSLLVSPDGQRMLVRSSLAQGPEPRALLIGSAQGGGLTPLSVGADLTVAEVRWFAPSTIWARLVDGFRNRLVRISGEGKPTPIELPLSVGSFDVSSNGDLVYVGEDYAHLPEIFIRTRDGRTRQVSHLQQGWAWPLAPVSIFRTRSFDGTMIEAALMKPAAPPAGKAPLVLLVHGGPSSNFTAGYNWEEAWAEMLAARGYQVLMVNPRGSNGYSEDFIKANRADWGGGDYRDLMAVLDAVIARGEIDPTRLGIGGWSYGGEMSTWAITQTDRFKAAVSGASVFNQAAEFETEGGPAGDEWYFGTPWEHPDVFARNSPSTYIRNAHTPTLIFDGIDDQSNPVGQSKGLYRALKHFGVETQMVLYPGEGHSPRRGSYNIDMFQRILDWYNGHLSQPQVFASSLGSTVSTVDDSEVDPPVTIADLKVVARARTLLESQSVWNRNDTRSCPAEAKTYSLYCAIEVATIQVEGHFAHREAAMQQARFVVDEVTTDRNYAHRLMDYNNDPRTSFSDIRHVFEAMETRIRAKLASGSRRSLAK